MDISKILYRYNAFDGNPEMFVRCSFSFYTCNGTLAVCMYRKPSHTMWIPDLYRLCSEPYAKITCNIPASTLLGYDEQFVNENEMPEIGAWLVVNGIAKPTGKYLVTEDGLLEAFRFVLPRNVYMEIKKMRRLMNTEPPSLREADNSNE